MCRTLKFINVHYTVLYMYLHSLFFLLHSYMYIHVPADPLDGPNPDRLLVTCVVIDNNVMFIKVTWDPVECAQLYILNISDIDSITTNQTSHQRLYSGSATNISVRLLAVGGPVLLHSEQCISLSIPTSTTLTTTTPTPTTLATTTPAPTTLAITTPAPTPSTRTPAPTTILGWFSVIGSLHAHVYAYA